MSVIVYVVFVDKLLFQTLILTLIKHKFKKVHFLHFLRLHYWFKYTYNFEFVLKTQRITQFYTMSYEIKVADYVTDRLQH